MMRALALMALLAAPAAGQGHDDILREHLWRQVRTLPRGERPVVGLALSAGSVRGLAHIGVIQVLEDAGFPIDVVAGTSIGAVVGSMYAAGVEMEQMRTFPDRFSYKGTSDFGAIRMVKMFFADSLIDTSKFADFLVGEFGNKRFDQLEKPFACVAMDLRTGEKIVFRDGPVAPAVRASSNLPGLFKPILYRHRYLVDGGVIDFIPAETARLLGAEWVLTSVTEGDFSRTVPSTVFMTLAQIFDIRGMHLARRQRKSADFIIEPRVGDIRLTELERSHEAIEKGMRAAKLRVEDAKEALILRTMPGLMKRWGDER